MQLAQSQTCNHIPASIDRLDVFWWVFAVRGGFAALFALLLLYAASLLGSIFFDPVMFVFMGLLLGFYILGNGVLLGVAARVAYKNHRHIAGLLLSECVFGIALGVYVGFSLMLTKQSFAFLVGIHALGVALFQGILAYRFKSKRTYAVILAIASIMAFVFGVAFLMHINTETKTIAQYLSGFELTLGLLTLTFAGGLHKSWVVTTETPA